MRSWVKCQDRRRASGRCCSKYRLTATGWCVSCVSATRSARVSWSWSAQSRAASSPGTSPSRGPRKRRMAAVCATTTRPARSTGGANGTRGPSAPFSTRKSAG